MYNIYFSSNQSKTKPERRLMYLLLAKANLSWCLHSNYISCVPVNMTMAAIILVLLPKKSKSVNDTFAEIKMVNF